MKSTKNTNLKLPVGAVTGRELITLHLERYIAENGAAATAAEAGITQSMLSKILRGSRQVSNGLAELVGYESKNLRFYAPRKGAKRWR